MKKIILLISFLFLVSVSSSYAQTVTECPEGKVCITQEAAKVAVQNAKLIPQLQSQIDNLQTAVNQERENTKKAQDIAKQNEVDLKDRLSKTEIELATAKGQQIGSDAEKTRLLALIDVLLKQVRPKQNGLINIKF